MIPVSRKESSAMWFYRRYSSENMWRFFKQILWSVSVLILPIMSTSYSTLANSIELTFRYSVLQGTCTLDVPSTLPFGSVETATSAIGKNWFFLNTKKLNVILKDCSGRGASGTRPAIKLINPSMATSGSAARKSSLFTSSSNKSGFGVVLSDGTLSNGSAANLVKVETGSTDAFIYLGAENTAYTGSGIILNAAIACGDASDCAGGNLKPANNETVSLQFAFVYH